MNTSIFTKLRAAKLALQEAQEKYDLIEAEALQVAASLDKMTQKEFKIEYRAGREMWDFSQCESWQNANAEMKLFKEKLKDIEEKEKALAKTFYSNQLSTIIDAETGEVITPMAKIEKTAKGAIILK